MAIAELIQHEQGTQEPQCVSGADLFCWFSASRSHDIDGTSVDARSLYRWKGEQDFDPAEFEAKVGITPIDIACFGWYHAFINKNSYVTSCDDHKYVPIRRYVRWVVIGIMTIFSLTAMNVTRHVILPAHALLTIRDIRVSHFYQA